jgi:hypothetical protein
VADAASDRAAPDAAIPDAASDTAIAASVVRTLAYHEISAFTGNATTGPLLSANGTRIAYAVAPGTEDPLKPNRIFVMNSDGSGNLEVDAYTSLCFCGSMVAISGDGNTVVSSDATQVRVAGADGSKKGSLVLTSNEISDIAISADGLQIFLLVRRDAASGAMPIERGLWTMNADGSGLHQVVGPTQVAGVVGTTADKVFPFAVCGVSMVASADGKHIALAVAIGGVGDTIFAVDAGGLRKLMGPVVSDGIGVHRIGISGDGGKVSYIVQPKGSGRQVGVMGWDGGGAKVITETNVPPYCASRLDLNGDGSQLLFGDQGFMYPTAGGDPLTLLQQQWAGEEGQVGSGGDGAQMTMTADAKRFAYANTDRNIRQFAMLSLDPASAGPGPSVAMPTLSTASIPRDRSVSAVLTAHVEGGGTLAGVGSTVYVKGFEDTFGSYVSGRLGMRDDGMRGDATAHDNVFTADGVAAGSGAAVGPRIVRIKAEAKAADGRRNATAIDFAGLDVK